MNTDTVNKQQDFITNLTNKLNDQDDKLHEQNRTIVHQKSELDGMRDLMVNFTDTVNKQGYGKSPIDGMQDLITNLANKLNDQDNKLHEQNRTIMQLTNKWSLRAGYEQIGVYGNDCTKKGSGTGTPRRCVKILDGGITQCELLCTSYNWCIGYAFHFDNVHYSTLSNAIRMQIGCNSEYCIVHYCNLIESSGTGTCPSGYTFNAGPTITSKEQFVAQNAPNYVCFAKTSN